MSVTPIGAERLSFDDKTTREPRVQMFVRAHVCNSLTLHVSDFAAGAAAAAAAGQHDMAPCLCVLFCLHAQCEKY